MEEEVRTLYDFQQTVDLGSLNWVVNLEEKPSEDRLTLKYDIDRKEVALFFRRKGAFKILASDFLDDFLKKTEFFLY